MEISPNILHTKQSINTVLSFTFYLNLALVVFRSILSQNLQKEHSPTDTFILALWDFYLQYCNIMNLGCFHPVSLWNSNKRKPTQASVTTLRISKPCFPKAFSRVYENNLSSSHANITPSKFQVWRPHPREHPSLPLPVAPAPHRHTPQDRRF